MSGRLAVLRRHAVLTPPSDGASLVSAAPGPDGELVALWASRESAEALTSRTVQPGWASFPDPRTAAPVTVYVATYRPELEAVVTIAEQPLAHARVQPLHGGHVLLVGARCRWRDGRAEPNAAVYDAEGELVREGVLGDGIAYLQTTPSGEIWAGYTDEGVYGNYGWGGRNSPEPIGAPGLIHFTSDLEIAWRYPAGDEFGGISHCYALNVTGQDAWAYYYTDFPVVRIRAGAVTGRLTGVGGARALVVADDRVVLVGGYGRGEGRVVVGSMAGEDFQVGDPGRLAMPGDRPVPPEATVVGRGGELHAVAGRYWLKLDFEDLVQGA
ncbi:hypothetical protein ACIBP6_40450 [Nonomuraea terrae]|uniref:hypothetical protein n=1 Tax=Nonomuraea terrae TaxID=2530383 RepID=UPI003795E891